MPYLRHQNCTGKCDNDIMDGIVLPPAVIYGKYLPAPANSPGKDRESYV